MAAVIVNKTHFLRDQRGAGLGEVLLALAIVTAAAPLVWRTVSDTSADIADMTAAKQIVGMRDRVLNFVRLNQDSWPDFAQIKMDDADLAALSKDVVAGFVDKYDVRGAARTDVYLAFDLGRDNVRTARVARHIGDDGAIVDSDGIAYGTSWAVTAPDFKPGDLIYRVTRDFSGTDKSKYLHRTASGDDNLNVMGRDLNIGRFNLYDIGGVHGTSAKIREGSALFVTAEDVTAKNVFFMAGANMDGNAAVLGALRVSGDVTGFRTITAGALNGNKFTTQGRVITDRASVANAVNVARDLTIKSDSMRTVSGFDGISVNAVQTSFLSANEMVFYENFGLTVSGELLVSTTAPLKIGSWSFPSSTPPVFNELILGRGAMPVAPGGDEFGPLMGSGWREVAPASIVGGQ